ncbi:hypothetical protein [Rhodoplanes sp. P11]
MIPRSAAYRSTRSLTASGTRADSSGSCPVAGLPRFRFFWYTAIDRVINICILKFIDEIKARASGHIRGGGTEMANHPNRSVTKQLLNDLLAYETDGANPTDGRRVIRDERLRLGAAIARDAKRANTERAIKAIKHPASNQGQAQAAAMRDELARLPAADHLSVVIAHARATLKAWST